MAPRRQREHTLEGGFVSLNPETDSFLTQSLPVFPASVQAFAERLSRGRSTPERKEHASAPPGKIAIDIAIEEAFFPTAQEILAAWELVSNIEHVTRMKGRSLVEVSQTHALVTRNAWFGTYDLRLRSAGAPHRRIMTVCAPWSMEAHRLFYATRSLYRQAISHEKVVEFDANGHLINTPVKITQIPLLIVKMPTRPGLRTLCMAVLDAIDEATGSNVLFEEMRRQRSTTAWIINLRRWVAGLNIGMIAIVGINSIHAKAYGFPEFVSGLNEIADSATGVALSMTPALYQGIADTALDLLCPTPPITIAGHAEGDYERLAQHCWALLARPEAMPEAMKLAIAAAHGQRQWIKLILRELNRRLSHQRGLSEHLFTGLVERACAGVSKQLALWSGQVIGPQTAAAQRDWIPLDWLARRTDGRGEILPPCAPRAAIPSPSAKGGRAS